METLKILANVAYFIAIFLCFATASGASSTIKSAPSDAEALETYEASSYYSNIGILLIFVYMAVIILNIFLKAINLANQL